jgi:hypothetical protein
MWTVTFRRLLPCPFNQGCEGLFAIFIEPQLSGIGPAFGNDRRRLKPEQAGPAGSESFVSPQRQLSWPTLRVAVTAFHRMDCQRIGYDHTVRRTRLDRLGQNRDILYRIDGDIKLIA